MRKPKQASTRQRGISLLEGVLYLALAASVIGFSASFLLEEQRRQEDIMIAQEISMALQASQRLISAKEAQIIEALKISSTSGPAARSYTLQELSSEGFLSATLVGEGGALDRAFGHDLKLLVRVVSELDAAPVRATLLGDEITSDLTDGDPDNDEARLEAVLFSIGDTLIPTQRGAPIALRTERSNVGFIEIPKAPETTNVEARGPYGAFSFDISGFSGIEGYPDGSPGRFAVLVALADPGALDLYSGESEGSDIDLRGYFQRCADILDIPGETESGDLYQGCLSASNDLFTDILFINDTNGDTVADTERRIIGTTLIRMGPPVDTDGDGVPDIESRIENLQAIGCGPVTSGSVAENQFLIDCALTRMTGNITADGDITSRSVLIDGGSGAETVISEKNVSGGSEIQIETDRVLMALTDADTGTESVIDLHTGIYDVLVVPPGFEVDKPTCPATTADGAFEMSPRIYTAPSAYANPDGFPGVGARAFAQESLTNPDVWIVRLIQYVAQDRCTLNFPESLPDNAPADACTFSPGNPLNPTDDPSLGNPDGNSDAYEVLSDYGRVLAMTRCF